MVVTNPLYQVPRLTALRYYNTLSSGANKPGIVAARDLASRQSVDCVVKFRGAERMTREACARELLAAFMAKQWGIKVIEPVLVEVTQAFADNERGKPHYSILSNSIGLNFGSIYLKGYDSIPEFQALTENELLQAQNIVFFDIFIQNADRRYGKPNLMSNGQDLVIYDHELAFGFIHEIFKNPNPCELRPADQTWVENMFLRSKINRHPLPEETVCQALTKFDNNFWQRALGLIPPEWNTDQLVDIRKYLTAICNNPQLFIQSAKRYIL